MELIVGVDAGGTASRAVVATVTGAVVGRGAAGPGNPVSGRESAAVEVGRAIRYALGAHDPSDVTGAVLGLAGMESADDPAVSGTFGSLFRGLGLSCPMTMVGDVVTAFAAGTSCPGGSVLIAGTGAIAARITGYQIAGTVDGLGWLLGDEGSGRWIGLQTVRAAVRDWPGSLGRLVAATSGAGSAEQAVRWAQELPLAAISALAPAVCAAARARDPAASSIVAAAVDRLLTTLDGLDSPADQTVVLAGGLLAADTPVRDGVRAVLRERGTPTGTARDPAGAAAWLAARPLSPLPPAVLHAALVG
jgi:glucosamine kinase